MKMTQAPQFLSVEELLSERRTTHGDFTDHAETTQLLKECMQSSPNWMRLSYVEKEALEMIQHKVGRVLSGDPALQDHWADIEGYARLVSQRLGFDQSQQPLAPLPPQQ